MTGTRAKNMDVTDIITGTTFLSKDTSSYLTLRQAARRIHCRPNEEREFEITGASSSGLDTEVQGQARPGRGASKGNPEPVRHRDVADIGRPHLIRLTLDGQAP